MIIHFFFSLNLMFVNFEVWIFLMKIWKREIFCKLIKKWLTWGWNPPTSSATYWIVITVPSGAVYEYPPKQKMNKRCEFFFFSQNMHLLWEYKIEMNANKNTCKIWDKSPWAITASLLSGLVAFFNVPSFLKWKMFSFDLYIQLNWK